MTAHRTTRGLWRRWLAAILLCRIPAPADDSRLTEALYRLSREAAQLAQTAPAFMARETVSQKALARKRSRFGVGPASAGHPLYQTREIVSYYALGALRATPEALHEFRESFSVDGQPIQTEASARTRFVAELLGGGDQVKKKMMEDFEKRCAAGSATDFGQLILLFARANLNQYSFQLADEARIGVDKAWLIAFTQQAGRQSLHISDAGRKIEAKLEGRIWVRQGDYLPLRIALTSARTSGQDKIRDEASVDYTVISGALLPAALTYRRQLNGEQVMESVYRYTAWQPVRPR